MVRIGQYYDWEERGYDWSGLVNTMIGRRGWGGDVGEKTDLRKSVLELQVTVIVFKLL